MQAAVLAVALLAADSQALPSAELDEAIKAAKAAEILKLRKNVSDAYEALKAAQKLPVNEIREASKVHKMALDVATKKLSAAGRAPGMVPHIGYEKLAVGQVGKLYYRGHVLGPFTTQPDGEIRGLDDAWHDLPVKARVWEAVDATTLHAEYKGVSFKVKTDTAGYKVDHELRLDVPLKVTGVDRTKPDDPVWEIRFFAK